MVEYFVKQLRGLLIIGIQEKVFKDAVKEFVLEIKELTYKFIWIQRCEENTALIQIHLSTGQAIRENFSSSTKFLIYLDEYLMKNEPNGADVGLAQNTSLNGYFVTTTVTVSNEIKDYKYFKISNRRLEIESDDNDTDDDDDDSEAMMVVVKDM
ncbi:hypothetical protein RhiirA1_478480 [Rhizophagus irregularis]|uniref:Uncharacterized protein n=1 Tax=Rhizophagus irregularis TaxID=588596 RepID=A0A2N0QS20_9GLOM|nr:hypothetical protein RhiirA1_478480 [Rhizophagus irregularis]